jgi:hypothetical protein
VNAKQQIVNSDLSHSDLRPTWLLRSVGWFFTDVSGQLVGAVFKEQYVREEFLKEKKNIF